MCQQIHNVNNVTLQVRQQISAKYKSVAILSVCSSFAVSWGRVRGCATHMNRTQWWVFNWCQLKSPTDVNNSTGSHEINWKSNQLHITSQYFHLLQTHLKWTSGVILLHRVYGILGFPNVHTKIYKCPAECRKGIVKFMSMIAMILCSSKHKKKDFDRAWGGKHF